MFQPGYYPTSRPFNRSPRQTGTQFLYGTPSPLCVEIATRTLTTVYFFLRPLPFLLLSHIHMGSLSLQRLIIPMHMRQFSDTPHFHPSTLTSPTPPSSSAAAAAVVAAANFLEVFALANRAAYASHEAR